ncbi:MAG TPA: DUF6262 family protein [Ktedonobacterales bacterium]|jgi:hypothetical protein
MSRTDWKRNTEGLQTHAQQRKEATLQRVTEAIDQLIRAQHSITFNSVAQAAQVTKAYLYQQPLLRERIEALREQHQNQAISKRTMRSHAKTDASKDLVILAKDRRIRELEAEVRRLTRELDVALGKLYERL